MVVYCFSFCGDPPGTNGIASPLYRRSRRVRTRLQVVRLHSTGCHLARLDRLHSTRGQVAFLLRRRSRDTPGLQAALLRRSGGRSTQRRSKGGISGKVGALHTLGTAGRTEFVLVMFGMLDW
jgi:hypothetical protein